MNNILYRDENQSMAINFLRFPLAVAVVFIHSCPPVVSVADASFPLISLEGLNNILFIVISQVFARIAVPLFFLISGYLFFFNFREWSWSLYCNKIKKRVKSLLLPYLLWNLIALVFIFFPIVLRDFISGGIFCVNYLSHNTWRLFWNINVFDSDLKNILGGANYGTGPIVIPLWFLRDLIVVSLLSPIIFWVIKKLGLYGMAILLFAYITRIWLQIPGFSITAFFYFGLGAYFSINGLNIVEISRKYSVFFYIVTFLLTPICIYFCGFLTVIGANIFQYYLFFAVFVSLAVTSFVIEKYKVECSSILLKSCFFIYAVHTIPIICNKSPIEIARIIVKIIIPSEFLIKDTICFFAVPFIAVGLCVFGYVVMSKICPRLTSVLSGNR